MQNQPAGPSHSMTLSRYVPPWDVGVLAAEWVVCAAVTPRSYLGRALVSGNPLALVSDVPDDLFEFPIVALLAGFAERAVPPPPEDDDKNCHRRKQRTDKDQDDHAYLSAGSEI